MRRALEQPPFVCPLGDPAYAARVAATPRAVGEVLSEGWHESTPRGSVYVSQHLPRVFSNGSDDMPAEFPPEETEVRREKA